MLLILLSLSSLILFCWFQLGCYFISPFKVATLKQGLLPITQDAALLGEVSYHEYLGVFVNEEEKGKIIQNLGPKNKVMFLRSHGVVVCGSTVEDAFNLLRQTVDACEQQVSV